MQVTTNGAQRASRRPIHRARAIVALAMALLATAVVFPGTATATTLPGTQAGVLTVGTAAALRLGLSTTSVPSAVKAARRPKVVLVVGPVGSYTTMRYTRMAKRLAGIARSYGATVREVYSPYATWDRVKEAARGASVFIYLGHGNGWPSQYGPYSSLTKNGLGLNARSGAGNSNTRYYGSAYVASGLRLAPGAVVILHHLCFASGNNVWNHGNPTRATAMLRADGYGKGFLGAGASAVFAAGLDDPAYIIRRLFHGVTTARELFWSTSAATRTWALAFASRQVSGASVLMDPYRPSRYFRSVVGRIDRPISAWGPPSSWTSILGTGGTSTGSVTSGDSVSASSGDTSAGTAVDPSAGTGSGTLDPSAGTGTVDPSSGTAVDPSSGTLVTASATTGGWGTFAFGI